MRLAIDPDQILETEGSEAPRNHDYWQWLKQLQEDKTTLQFRVTQAIEQMNQKWTKENQGTPSYGR